MKAGGMGRGIKGEWVAGPQKPGGNGSRVPKNPGGMGRGSPKTRGEWVAGPQKPGGNGSRVIS